MKKYIYELRFNILIQVICDGLYTISLACIPYLQKILFDEVIDQGIGLLGMIIFLYIAITASGLLFQYIASICQWKCGIAFEVRLKTDFFKTLTSYDYKRFYSNNIGEYISLQGNDITSLQQDYLDPLLAIIKSINMLIIYSITLFVFVDWRIAITIITMSIFSVMLPKVTSKELSTRRNNYQVQMGQYVSRIKDLLEGFLLINSTTRKNFNNEHEKVLLKTADKRFFYGKFKTLTYIVNGTAINLVSLTAFILVGILLVRGEITIGTAVATFGYIDCFISPIHSILEYSNLMRSLNKVKERVIHYLQPSSVSSDSQLCSFTNSITFNDVSVSYDRFELKHFSYNFKKGNKYAIIGHSGAGKTTLLKVLLKHITDYSGTILVDNQDLTSIDTCGILSFISQNEHIFADSFQNNTTIFSSYEENNIEWLPLNIKEKMLNKLIEKENCELISGGEKQLINVIRMINSAKPIFIMDEPFSSMDVNTTQSLQKAFLEMKDQTVIMVTHKLSEQLMDFDEILLIENGRLVQHGTFKQIVGTSEYLSLQQNN